MLSFLSLAGVAGIVRNMYDRLKKYLGRTEQGDRGTRSHGIGPRSTQAQDQSVHEPAAGKKVALDEIIIEKLCGLLNAEVGVERFTPASLLTKERTTQIFLHAQGTQHHALRHEGVTYRPLYRSPGDSNILLHSTENIGSSGVPYCPARILKIFTHTRMNPRNAVVTEVFCAIQRLKPLPSELVEKDWFRKFGAIGGSLWSGDYGPTIEVIRPSAILCHFAKTPLELEEMGVPTFHVFPLDRVRRTLHAVHTQTNESSS